MNVAQCPQCDSHAITFDPNDPAKLNDTAESLTIEYPMTCQDCGATLVLHATATAIEHIKE